MYDMVTLLVRLSDILGDSKWLWINVAAMYENLCGWGRFDIAKLCPLIDCLT
jgi:hypothetical protein